MGELVMGVFPAKRASGVPWPRSRRLWWLLWSRCPGLGWVRLRQLESAFGGLEAAWSASPGAIAKLPGWPGKQREVVESFRARWGKDPLALLLATPRQGLGVLLPGDHRWPRGMGSLQRPPLGLYWKGRGSLWAPLHRRLAVAVVGTRRPSSHGLAMARSIGAALARSGWPVVSGLAEGIDAAAHLGCLEQAGRPVAVLGTPLDRVYPRHHEELQKQVSRQGLLVSEQPPGAHVQAAHFATRNRLQVALAAAVVVVECPESSGALHSAEHAWKEELPLWVVPADAGKASAAGSNRLLALGATPLLSPPDLIDQLGPGPLTPHAPPALGLRAGRFGPGQRALLEAVGPGASLDQLTLSLGRPAGELASQLLTLELAGALRAEPGLGWRPL